MHSFVGTNANSVWQAAAKDLLASGYDQPSRAGPTKEIRPVAIQISDSRDRIVFARPMNPAFAVAEVLWILAGSDDAGFVEFWNPRMKDYVDPGARRLHGAYGARLGSRPKLSRRAEAILRGDITKQPTPIDQLKRSEQILTHSPATRQLVLQIWDKEVDLPNPDPVSNDVPCNVASQLLVRGGQLEWFQLMRSTDIVWGLTYNLVQWTTLQEIVAGWTGHGIGTFTLVSDSLHVYRRHLDSLSAWATAMPPVGLGRPSDLGVARYSMWEQLFEKVVDDALDIMDARSEREILAAADRHSDLPGGYREWLFLLAADGLRRQGHEKQARELVLEAGKYWSTSWLAWADNRGRT
ncbi:MAG: thymidylate synthase [Thermoplasmata archaeon]|nr:thymidylate synthase [Thermoplasmata archaeon]